jgi:hypothetical protein
MINESIKKAIYLPINLALTLYGRNKAKNYDISNSIVIVSSPRGGSTWLAEIVSTIPGYFMLWEPLHLKNNPECINYGFDWRNYIPVGTKDQAKEDYIRQILTGEKLSTRTTTRNNFNFWELNCFRGYLVKFVTANMMLPWLTDLFPIRIIWMIRHPCAVVASQMEHGSWSHISKKNKTAPVEVFEQYPRLEKLYKKLDKLEELLAFEWALQTYVPLMNYRESWFFTTYEYLLTEGNREVNRLFNYLDEPLPHKIDIQFRKASSTASQEYSKNPKDQLTKWQNKLTTKQVNSILQITHEVGVTCYTDEIYPQYDQLPNLE